VLSEGCVSNGKVKVVNGMESQNREHYHVQTMTTILKLLLFTDTKSNR